MRNFPSSTDLSDLQKSIYSADLNSAMMILGPPGTGKTVLAIHRAMRLLELNEDSIGLFMYNNTLSHYTKNQTSQNNHLSQSVKTVMKHIGDRFKLVNRYIRWGQEHELKEFPYEAYTGRYDNLSDEDKQKLFPKYTILDEGQDYPEVFYRFIAKHWVTSRNKGFDFYPTIMADENQRLEAGRNADIDTIESVFGSVAKIESLYSKKILKENYRNTLPIAKLGSRFYVGINQQAELPAKNGNKPEFFFFNDYKELAKRIIKYKINFPNQTIGILYSSSASRNMVIKMNNHLIRELQSREDELTKKIIIQHYLSDTKNIIDFTNSNTITVLTYQSAKGLEFDAVFIPDIEKLDTSDNFYDDAMKMYVLLHRPREMLFLAAQNKLKNTEKTNKLPSFFTKKISCYDHEGVEIEIGFKGIDDVKTLINIESEEINNSKFKRDDESIHSSSPLIKKDHIAKVSKTDLTKASKDSQEKIDVMFDKIKDEEFKKLPLNLLRQIEAFDTDEKLSLLKRVNEYSQEKNRGKSRQTSHSKKLHKSSSTESLKLKKKVSSNKKQNSNEVKDTIISYVAGSGKYIEQKIVLTIKDVMVKKNIEVLNIISLSEMPSSILQRLNSILLQNRKGIAEYFMLNERDSKIILESAKKLK